MTSADDLGIGVIGCGRIAQARHLPVLHKLRGVRLAALADSDPVVLAEMSRRYPAAHAYDTHQALLQNPDVHAVLVCTPPQDHFVPARDVLMSGRHLYVDSPLAVSVEQCNELVTLASRAGRVATVGLNLRQHSQVRRARHDIVAGRIGTLQAISSIFTTPSRGLRGDVFPAWRQPASVEGNVFGESSIQHFDIWRLLTGAEFSEVSVQCPVMGGPVAVTARLQQTQADSTAPVAATAVFSEYSGNHNEIRVIGSHGTLCLSLYQYNGYRYFPALGSPGSARAHLAGAWESIRSLPQGLANLAHQGEYGATFERQLEVFAAACRGGKQRIVTLEDGRAATVAALAAYQSMASGQAIALDAGVDQFLGCS